MEERMEEARIGLIDEVDEVDESEVVTTALTDAQIEVLKRKANDAIRISATERKNSKSFKGEAIDHSIAELQLSGLEDTEEYFALILERLMCECKVVYDKPNEHKAYIYDYAFEDLEAFKSSKSYQLLCEMGGKHRRLFDVAEESIFSQISRYYSVLAEYGDVDVVIIYDAERKDIYEKLCDDWRTRLHCCRNMN